jgi:hypothetical protein
VSGQGPDGSLENAHEAVKEEGGEGVQKFAR